MLGRGMVADPGLARALRAADAGQPGADTVAWAELLPHLMDFWRLVCADLEPRQRAGRLKQWLNLMRRRFPEAERAYQQVRTMTDQAAITLWLQALPTADCPVPVAPAA
jgi:tRNA-dihydrouridine synthase C